MFRAVISEAVPEDWNKHPVKTLGNMFVWPNTNTTDKPRHIRLVETGDLGGSLNNLLLINHPRLQMLCLGLKFFLKIIIKFGVRS
jgi:hypothetical protein